MGGEASQFYVLNPQWDIRDRISALPNSRANGFAFIDTDCAKDV